MIKKVLNSFLLMTFLLFSFSVKASAENNYGDRAYKHVQQLNSIGNRVTGTEANKKSQEYLIEVFKSFGYNTEAQKFSFNRKGTDYEACNLIATKPGVLNKQIIIGAHYDTVAKGHGVDDNGSGVGVMLEVAEKIKNMDTPYTIKFIAFGAEELGLQGSKYYASKMSKEEIDNTVVMINLDSLAVGDNMYVYGTEGENGYYRDKALSIAKALNLKLGTNEGINPEYPKGTTGDWSDHAPFKALGIEHAYFEATNWLLGDKDGYVQTEKDGAVWHTDKDDLQYIEQNYENRIKDHLNAFTLVLEKLALSYKGKAIKIDLDLSKYDGNLANGKIELIKEGKIINSSSINEKGQILFQGLDEGVYTINLTGIEKFTLKNIPQNIAISEDEIKTCKISIENNVINTSTENKGIEENSKTTLPETGSLLDNNSLLAIGVLLLAVGMKSLKK